MIQVAFPRWGALANENSFFFASILNPKSYDVLGLNGIQGVPRGSTGGRGGGEIHGKSSPINYLGHFS